MQLPPLPALDRLMARFAVVSLSALVFCTSSCVAEDASELYRNQIRSLLAEKCFACHGQDVQEADLRLDSQEAATRELASGATAIVQGDANASELIRRVASVDPDLRMPPEGEPLSAHQITHLKQWIEAGAPYAKHWAYTDLNAEVPPDVRDEAWISNPIDRYVLSKLEQRGIAPSSRADRYTLIKRVYYDLVGLPPPIETVDAFVDAQDPEAYERLVDSLLASEHFGERWGRRWLDKARYADSDGYEKDRPRPNAWKYRDWVIDAINDDMPIDQFTIQQLAGDLLPAASEMQRLATAFHRQTLTNTEGGVDQEEFRVEAVFDRTETTGAVWLGLTVGCARCHSHKYDAISQEEYYRLFAFFNNGDESNFKLPESEAAMAAYQTAKAQYEAQLADLNKQIESAKQDWKSALAAWQTDLANKLRQLKPATLHPIDVSRISGSVDGREFTRLDDGGYLVSGVVGDEAVDYSIEATAKVNDPLTAIQIETLKHDKLPKSGPGRVAHGNFVLSELIVKVDDQPIAFSAASADFAQQGWPAKNAIDGKLDTGWAISPKMGQNHHIRVALKTPATISADSELTIQLRQHYGSQHTIGCFRIRLVTGVGSADDLAPKEIREIVLLESAKRNKKQNAKLADYFLRSHYSATKPLYAQLDALQKKAPVQPLIQVRVIAQRNSPRQTKVFDRGVFLNPTHTVTAGGLESLPPIAGRSKDGLDRLDLARWLFSDDNPLPPRVLANHVWLHLFGHGLVRTVNDFGVRGQPPTHPKLLDWLATHYRRLGWSRKRIIKTILMSSTYRQASHHREDLQQIDPENRLLARQNRLRVPAEIVRDLCLSASGLLSDKVGGPSVFPPLPADVASLSYANNFKWKTSQGDDRYRRGMYTFFKRTSPHPNLTVFDCPDSNTTNLSRRISNTPLQALTVLNNEVYHEAAQALAGRVLKLTLDNDQSRVENLLRLCLSRPPSSFEKERFVRLLESSRAWYAGNKADATAMASRHREQAVPIEESAAWVAVARIALNLDEFVTRE